MSETVTVVSDSASPGAPGNLALELVANGIKATWNTPAYTETITYNLYRSSQPAITTVERLTFPKKEWHIFRQGIQMTELQKCYTGPKMAGSIKPLTSWENGDVVSQVE